MDLAGGGSAAGKRRDEEADSSASHRPIPFTIDLNETPSPSGADTPSSSATPPGLPPFPWPTPADAYALACRVHANPSLPATFPAEFPGETGLGFVFACGGCGKPETRGSTVVCDGCERGFHLSCARVRPRQLTGLGDWVCGACLRSGERSKRWPVGRVFTAPKRSGMRLLDINALPPNEGDGEMNATEEFHRHNNVNRIHSTVVDSLGGFARTFPQVNFAPLGNGVCSELKSSTMSRRLQKTTNDSPQQRLSVGNCSPAEMFNGDNIETVRTPNLLQQEMYLQSLKEFILERHGSMDEGWYVEFKQRASSCDSFVVFCSPDGKKFESMFDVARYLGLASSICDNVDEKNDGRGPLQKSLSRRRKKKELARLSKSSNLGESQDITKGACGGDISDNEAFDNQIFGANYDATVIHLAMDGQSISTPHLSARLPIQYEDFFILHLGKIDNRPAYHNENQIWPIGYKSCWHDKITGSLFECDISDGGSSGPIFRVARRPCSTLSVLVGETILKPSIPNKAKDTRETEIASFIIDSGCDMDNQIQILLSDPCPLSQDLLSCFSISLNEDSVNTDGGNPSTILSEPSDQLMSYEEKSKIPGLSDQIGEFYVEGRSPASVWNMVSKNFVDACHEAYKQSHSLQFYCEHNVSNTVNLYPDDFITKPVEYFGSLARFCYSTGAIEIPCKIYSESDLETACKSLGKWINQDRFGLDMDFTQEVIEQIPGAQTCALYKFLIDRGHYSSTMTVGSGFFVAKRGTLADDEEETISRDSYVGHKRSQLYGQSSGTWLDHHCLPPAQTLNSKLPAELVGDLLQIREFFCRFYELLGLKEPFSFEELEDDIIDPWSYDPRTPEEIEKENHGSRELSLQGPDSAEVDSAFCGENKFIQVETVSMKEAAEAKAALLTYGRCTGVALTKAHISLLKVLVGELQCKVAVFAYPNFDGEPKFRRGRRKETDNYASVKKPKIEMLPMNELTWPELSRRYILAVSAMDCNLDSSEISSREGSKVFRCLQGDGGLLCGSLPGVAGMEADALLLAEAGKQISESVKQENEVYPVEYEDLEDVIDPESIARSQDVIPEWAQVLEPVRKLPTNVGTRIRKCINESLSRDPPEWARKILEHSISKEVYKGNASGPTKKAVLSVLAEINGEKLCSKPDKRKKRKRLDSASNLIMKQCRIVLRRSLLADEGKVFCNLLGTALPSFNDNDDEGILGSPAMVSRPLDFRTVDLRLAVGAYGGSHEIFLEDVREVWQNIRTAYGDRPDLMELVDSLSKNFELLYEKEVVDFVKTMTEKTRAGDINSEVQRKLDHILHLDHEVPKAPWEEGVCKICGIDKDDDSVLLCDTCDSEYHTYCLSPPLSRIPAGNWYCPSCVSGQSKSLNSSYRKEAIRQKQREMRLGDELLKDSLTRLAASLGEREYWNLTIEERIFLLKFLCDEAMNTILFHEHLDQCANVSSELQQKLRYSTTEWRNLKFKEAMLTARQAKEVTSSMSGFTDSVKEDGLMGQQFISGGSINFTRNSLRTSDVNMEDSHEENGLLFAGKHLAQPSQTNSEDLQVNGMTPGLCNLHGHSDSKCSEQQKSINDLLVNPIDGHLSLARKEAQLKGSEPNAQLKGSEPNLSPHLHHHNGSNGNAADFTKPENADVRPFEISNNSDCNLDSAHLTKLDIDDLVPGMNDVLSEKSHLDTNTAPLPFSSMVVTSVAGSVHSGSNGVFLQQNTAIPADVTDSPSSILELDSLKNEILNLQESIISLESQLLMGSIRREFLGRDSLGRTFWTTGRPRKHPWLLVDGTVNTQQQTGDSENSHAMISSYLDHADCLNMSSWCIYESDKDVQELLNWLRDYDPRERELKECILQWQRHKIYQVWVQHSDDIQTTSKPDTGQVLSPSNLLSKASILLEKKYGPCLDLETSDIPRKRGRKMKANHDTKMYRCDCLEPVWPSRHHCLSCHQTFCSIVEFESHSDGRCTISSSSFNEIKEKEGLVKGKGVGIGDCFDELGDLGTPKNESLNVLYRLIKVHKRPCPYSIEEISNKFIVKNSNKDLVKEIGFLGSNENSSLIQESFPYCIDQSLIFIPLQKCGTHPVSGQHEENFIDDSHPTSLQSEENSIISKNMSSNGIAEDVGHFGRNSQISVRKDSCINLSKTPAKIVAHGNKERVSYLHIAFSGLDGNHNYIIPESSLRPLSGKAFQILKRLKICLLDMDAALPDEALRPLKADSVKRCAWRAFVKSAESIYEMVQATILLEGMIRTDFLKNEWWLWSSLTAAARIPTISSLALRIYTLDAFIIYSKASDSIPELAINSKVTSKIGKKRKEMDSGS